MTPTLLSLALAAALATNADAKDTPRKPNPFAPSLPLLTDEEEERLDKIVDAWILYDSGQLGGAAGKKARSDFMKLGPESIFALIRGLNRAAEIEHSCPVVTIAKKVSTILSSTDDVELLDFARENIGAGVKATRHTAVIKDLRFSSTMRRNLVYRAKAANPGPKPPRSMTNAELTRAAGSERGERLKNILTELGQRQGDEVISALAAAATSYEGDVRQTARSALISSIGRLPNAIEGRFKDDRPEVRAAAARAAGKTLGGKLIDLLEDSDAAVREATHEALVRLNRGTDFGPSPNASDNDRSLALQRWREWWSRQGGR